MLAEELITTKTQERLPCNWVKIKVFFKKIASVPLGGSCESGGVPPLWEPPSQWEEISGDRQGASEESAATALRGQSGKTPSDSRCHLADPSLRHSSAGAGGVRLGFWRLDPRRGPGLAV